VVIFLLARMRLLAVLAVLAELAVFVAVVAWIGIGWTVLAMLATSALGFVLLARQGVRALTELRDRARTRQPAGRELGDAGLVAVGGLLMVLPGFLGDLVGLLCLLPGTRWLVRGALTSVVLARLPDRYRGPVRARSFRVEEVGGFPANGATRATSGTAPLVIEGEVVRETPPDRPAP
jgi:UPF0716 protein FxsA